MFKTNTNIWTKSFENNTKLLLTDIGCKEWLCFIWGVGCLMHFSTAENSTKRRLFVFRTFLFITSCWILHGSLRRWNQAFPSSTAQSCTARQSTGTVYRLLTVVLCHLFRFLMDLSQNHYHYLIFSLTILESVVNCIC